MSEITIRNEINTDEDTYWTKCVFNNSFNEALYKGSLALSDLTMTICGLLNQEVEECHEIPMTDLEDLDITK